MTNSTENQEKYQAFFDAMDELSRADKLNEQAAKDPRSKVKDNAIDDLVKYAQERALKDGVDKLPNDFYNQDIQKYIGLRSSEANERSANILSGNLESIVNEIPSDKLSKLAGSKEIAERVEGEDIYVLGAYRQWKFYEGFKEKYEKGEPISGDEEKIIGGLREIAAKSLGNKLAEKVKNEGYSKDIQNQSRALAYAAVQHGYVSDIKEDVLSGLEKLAEEHKKNYEKIAYEKTPVEEIFRKTLKKMGSDKDIKEFELARNLVYKIGKEDDKN